MTKIKICGITNLEDAMLAVKGSADALGFVFADSPRRISPLVARDIISALPPFISKVGVFVNEDIATVDEIFDFCMLDVVQLHGDEDLQYISDLSLPVIKAFKVKDASVLNQIRQYNLSYFLLDAFDDSRPGGTGRRFDWKIARDAGELGRLVLSGGLNHENIREALESVHPYAVDVCSGAELYPGKKNRRKMERFTDEVRHWDIQTD